MACGSGPKLDPFEVWKDVTSPADARRLLVQQSKLIGSVEKMDDWLECQGFHADVITGKVGSFPDAPEAEKRLSFSFIIEEHGGRRLWPRQFPWLPVRGYSFIMVFDFDGKAIGIGIDEVSIFSK